MGTRTLIDGFGLAGYRGFFHDLSFFHPMTPVTFVAGANNAGKSNVLRFLGEVWPRIGAGQRAGPRHPALTQHDVPVTEEPTAFKIALPLRADWLETAPTGTDVEFSRAVYRFILKLAALRIGPDLDVPWVLFEKSAAGDALEISPDLVHLCVLEGGPVWEQRWRRVLTEVLGGGTVDPRDVMARCLTRMIPVGPEYSVTTIGNAPTVQPETILDLNKLLNPEAADAVHARHAVNAVTRFIRTVMDDDTVDLQIPHSLATINVTTPHRTLSLDNLGAGIQRVIQLAVEATATEHTVVCIEEPETNLHPVLQRRLAQYLLMETSNQYVIATHSAHMLNYEQASVIHLSFADTTGTTARLVSRPREHSALCADLGYRPADLLQSNSIVWVEGPSDRLYVRRWIDLLDVTLREGIEYSVMFYGGALLSHLSADDEAVNDFIHLRRLNRHMSILIDSDRHDPASGLNATKQRIVAEYTEGDDGFAWVTGCRTIENYVDPEVLAMAVAAVHPDREPRSGQWEAPLAPTEDGKRFDKVAVAHAVVPLLTAAHLDRFDLRGRVEELVAFIRRANGRT
ncbi:MAG TPA: AAA family ATPase [Mycobacteriales bacterium]|jgi:hypothetical protein|nr:AAA family ATPase [Mycobacteriales bacterium]